MFGKPLNAGELPSVVNAALDRYPKIVTEDPKGGPRYNQHETVRREILWKDRLGRESRTKIPGWRPAFQMNMANTCMTHNRMELVTEKEIKQSPETRKSLKGMDQDGLEVAMIKHSYKTPTEKWDLPATSSQEMSWLLAHHVRPDTFRRMAMRTAASSCAGTALDEVVDHPMSPVAVSTPMPLNQHVLARSQSEGQYLPRENVKELKHLNPRKYAHPRMLADVTGYAETYSVMMHRNPFQHVGEQTWTVKDPRGTPAPSWR